MIELQLEEARKLEEAYDEKLRIEREKNEAESREDRIKAREAMKELRAQRAIERDFKTSAYQRSKVSQWNFFLK